MDFLTPKEAAVLVGVTKRTLRNWVRSGRIRSHPDRRGHVRYDRSELLAAARRIEPPAAAQATVADPDPLFSLLRVELAGVREERLQLLAQLDRHGRILESLVERLR